MNGFQKGEIEMWRAALRVLVICLAVSVAAIFAFEYLRFAGDADGWHAFTLCQSWAFFFQMLTAMILIAVSLYLVYRRDLRYGWVGIIMAALSFLMWLYPSKAVPRADAGILRVVIAIPLNGYHIYARVTAPFAHCLSLKNDQSYA